MAARVGAGAVSLLERLREPWFALGSVRGRRPAGALSRLWAARVKRHWPRAAAFPRKSRLRPFWTLSIWAKTGSTMALRRLYMAGPRFVFSLRAHPLLRR